MEIKFTDGYFMEKDEWQWILQQRYMTKGRNGKSEEHETVRVIGYYRTLEQAIQKYITLMRKKLIGDKVLTLKEYVKAVETSNKLTVEAIKNLVEGKQ